MTSYSTGDLQNNVEKLRRVLRSIQYAGVFDVSGIVGGNPETFLPLLDYSIMGFSRYVAKYTIKSGFDFYSHSDLKFVQGVFQFIRKVFGYNPCLTVSQFLSKGFAERKIILLCKVINNVKKKHNELVKSKRKKKKRITTSRPSTARERLLEESLQDMKPVSNKKERISRKKHNISVQKHTKRSFVTTDKYYDGNPVSNDTENHSFIVNVSPSNTSVITESQTVQQEPSRELIRSVVSDELENMKSELLKIIDEKMDRMVNVVTTRMSLIEGKVKFLENMVQTEKKERILNKTENIVREMPSVVVVQPERENNIIEPEDDEFENPMDKVDPANLIEMKPVSENRLDNSVTSFIMRYRRKNEEAQRILSDLN